MKQTIYLAAGCFWGTQVYFDLLPGVIKTTVGYANGNQYHVTYEQVCQGNTNFAETCQIIFDDKIISLATLLAKYWKIIDPTLLNRQGNDIGSQYRTGIYYDKSFSPTMINILQSSKDNIANKLNKKIYTEILPLTIFIAAEDEHQKYLKKHPGGYCHIDLSIK